jgi:putative transposase
LKNTKKELVSFIDENRMDHGVEPLCKNIQIAPSTYYEMKSRKSNPDLEPARIKRDNILKDEIRRVWFENRCVYGAKKVWQVMNKEKIPVARCSLERLMRSMGLNGVIRGKKVRTTIPAKDNRPDDLVNRNFTASRPNQLWVADFTYVSTWRGFVYVAFFLDVFSRMIVGWRASMSMKTDFTLDALNQALWARQVTERLIHHSDRGSQFLAISYTERLLEAGIDP